MNNKFNAVLVFFFLLTFVLGCSFFNPSEEGSSNGGRTQTSNDKTFSQKAIDSTIGEEKIGVPECDDVVEFFARLTESEGEDFVTKAARGYALNKIRQSFKNSIEKNKGDTTKMAKDCADFKQQLDKYKSEGNSNKK